MKEDNTNEEVNAESIERKINDNNHNSISSSDNNISEKEESTKEIIQDDKTRNKSTLKKVLSIIGKLLIWAIIIISVTILVRVLVLKKYDILGYRFYIIMSGSMEPTINTRDGIITKEIKEEPQKGDIIAFENSKSVTVHRIVAIDNENGETLYQTKGDNNNTVDATKVKLSEIKGKVVFTIPNIGDVVLFVKSHIIIFVYIIAFIIIVLLVRRLM